mgnify:CR=1 FL=1
MPFEIVRNDITNMAVDAIVNTANPKPLIGSGTDAGIHAKAGPALLEARKKIGNIPVGSSAITLGYGFDAKYVIHTVGPVWQGGGHDEEKLLRQCYDSALNLADSPRTGRCKSPSKRSARFCRNMRCRFIWWYSIRMLSGFRKSCSTG